MEIKIKTAATRLGFNILVLVATCLGNEIHAAPLNSVGSKVSGVLGNSETGSPGTLLATSSASNLNRVNTIPPILTFSHRLKRNTIDKAPENGMDSFRNLFPVNIADPALLGLLHLLEVKPGDSDLKNGYADDFEDEVIDLYARRPAIVKFSAKGDNKYVDHVKLSVYLHHERNQNILLCPHVFSSAWAGDEPTTAPISLYQHRINKKAGESRTFREMDAAITNPRTQPEPVIMRKLLAQMILRPNQGSEKYTSNDGRFYSLGQLLEHSSRINDNISAVPRLVL